jgi:hypothetical protein
MPAVQRNIMSSASRDDVVLAVEDMDAETAAIDRRRLEEDEQAPLLRDGGEGGDDPAWKLPSEFESVPWWRRPSVRLNRFAEELADRDRYSGSSFLLPFPRSLSAASWSPRSTWC